MTEHKFTDEEVIKAIEVCAKAECWGDCKDMSCPAATHQGCRFYLRTDEDYEGVIQDEMLKDALDLIKRQKAEIKHLEDTLCGKLSASAAFAIKYMDRKGKEVVREIKAEAIKEFAQRLKTYYRNLDKTAGGLVEYHIDQIAKEFLERGAADSQDNH